MKKKLLAGISAIVASFAIENVALAQLGKFIAINGVMLTQPEIIYLESQLGFSLTPGNYFTDGQCVIHVESRSNNCSNISTLYQRRRWGCDSTW